MPITARPAQLKASATVSKDSLNAEREAIASAADVSGGLWLSYLAVLVYLLIAVGSVTHWDMLRTSSVKLPLIDVELPLVGFCWLGPLLFLVIHAYTLLHYRLLAHKSRSFALALNSADEEAKSLLLLQLPINAFVQMMAGADDARQGLTGFLLRSITWISLAIGPLMLLVFFELRFVPYHDEATTWWQRCAVVVDFAMLFVLWPKIISQTVDGRPTWRCLGRLPRTLFFSLGAVAFVTVFLVATFPGEHLDAATRHLPFRHALIDGDVDPATSRPTSLWTNRLVVSGRDIVDHSAFDTAAKLAGAPVTVALRGRHLEGAVFIDARLPRADFTGAYLQGADFTRARLAGGWFDHAEMSGARLEDAELQGASLFHASLPGASLRHAQLSGAPMAGALLIGAILDDAKLQGAGLAGADLRGASLQHTDLRGANLATAWLEGASFLEANLEGASLAGSFVWLADFTRTAAGAAGFMRDAATSATKTMPPCDGLPKDACDRDHVHDSLPSWATRDVQDPNDRDLIQKRLSSLQQSASLDPDKEMALAKTWKSFEAGSSNHDARATPLGRLWQQLACAVEGGPFVATSLIQQLDDASAYRLGAPETKHIVEMLLTERCAAYLTFDEVTRMHLRELVVDDGSSTKALPSLPNPAAPGAIAPLPAAVQNLPAEPPGSATCASGCKSMRHRTG